MSAALAEQLAAVSVSAVVGALVVFAVLMLASGVKLTFVVPVLLVPLAGFAGGVLLSPLPFEWVDAGTGATAGAIAVLGGFVAGSGLFATITEPERKTAS